VGQADFVRNPATWVILKASRSFRTGNFRAREGFHGTVGPDQKKTRRSSDSSCEHERISNAGTHAILVDERGHTEAFKRRMEESRVFFAVAAPITDENESTTVSPPWDPRRRKQGT